MWKGGNSEKNLGIDFEAGYERVANVDWLALSLWVFFTTLSFNRIQRNTVFVMVLYRFKVLHRKVDLRLIGRTKEPRRMRHFCCLLTWGALLAACTSSETSKKPIDNTPTGEDAVSLGAASSRVETFESHEEFLSNLRAYASKLNESRKSTVGAPMETSAPQADASDASNDSITNNQEAGVDEGGIVKNIGDSLVVLRKGRLYAIDVSASPTQTDSITVARSEGLNQNVWYDELLVKGNLVYVIGYRYITSPGLAKGCRGPSHGATELNSYRLSEGKFERLQTQFMESNDYFSGSNYASRLVGSDLIMYMPKALSDYCFDGERFDPKIPRYISYAEETGFVAGNEMFSGMDVFKNMEDLVWPVFHSYVKCSLPETGAFACNAKAYIGDWYANRYVTQTSAYAMAAKAIYRFDLSDMNLTVHAASGIPLDRFSFHADASSLNVFVSERREAGSSGDQETKKSK